MWIQRAPEDVIDRFTHHERRRYVRLDVQHGSGVLQNLHEGRLTVSRLPDSGHISEGRIEPWNIELVFQAVISLALGPNSLEQLA